MKKAIAIMAIILLAIAIGFGITSGLVYVVCWTFGFKFTWKIAIGIYLILVILKALFHNPKNK